MKSLSKIVGLFLVGSVVSCAASSKNELPGNNQGGAGGAVSGSGGGGSGGSGQGGDVVISVGSGGHAGGGCVDMDMNSDADLDGFTDKDGDCNDCDPNVNPGAIEVGGTNGGNGVDEDCNNKIDDLWMPCDDGLALLDSDPKNGARATDLCQFIDPADATDRRWGVLEAKYVRANGQDAPQPEQFGIFDGFGPNTHVQVGKRMLALSSGRARRPGDPNPCLGTACNAAGGQTTAPMGFPQTSLNCPLDTGVNDDVALEVKLRVPTNATGYQFFFDFYSFEFPDFVCTSFNDQFIALVNPPPTGSVNGNISFDSKKNPVSVNLAFFNVCDPASKMYYGFNCVGTCPSPPSPYCPLGTAGLQGTGFDAWAIGGAGATGWLVSSAPVTGGQTITIRWAIWDTGDSGLDSTVLVDGFSWISNGGVTVETEPVPVPK